MLNLKVILASTRPGRKGIYVAEWIMEALAEQKEFNVELLDLAKINLPMMDEPHHPRLQKYEHEHTKQWSKTISEADAFIIVTAEYNFAFPATIKNALDYLFLEWKYKPVGIVSYGGQSGGLRSSQMLKQVITALNMMPIAEAVTIPFFATHINEEQKFIPTETLQKNANGMFRELHKWGVALKTIRTA